MSVGLRGACGRQPWSLPLLQLQSCPGKSCLPSGEIQDQHAGHDVMLMWEIALVPTVPSRVHGNTALKIPAMAIKTCLNYFLFDLRADDNFSFSFMINYSDNPGIKTNGGARVSLTACSEPLAAHLKAGLGTLPSQL